MRPDKKIPILEREHALRHIFVVFAVTAALLLFSIPAVEFRSFAESGVFTDPQSGITWSYNTFGNDGYLISNCSNIPDSGIVTVPAVINGKDVKRLGADLFKGNTKIKELYFPDSIDGFLQAAFEDCTALKKVRLPEGLGGISSQLFSGCTSLETIELPDSVTLISSDAFTGCRSLKSIEIPAATQTIPNSTSILFSGCSSLESITVDPGNKNFSDVNGILFTKDCAELLRYPEGRADDHYDMPQNTTKIAIGAFKNAKLKTITLQPGITEIPDNCFYGASKLTEVTVPEGVVRIGADAFFNNKSLAKLTLPKSLKTIGEHAFYFTAFKELNIPDGVETISTGAFEHTRLVRIKLPSSLKRVEDYLFDQSAIKEVTIPGSVESIGRNPFRYAGLLEYIYIPASVTQIDAGVGGSDTLFYGASSSLKVYGESGSYIQKYLQTIGETSSVNFIRGTYEEYQAIVDESIGDGSSSGSGTGNDGGDNNQGGNNQSGDNQGGDNQGGENQDSDNQGGDKDPVNQQEGTGGNKSVKYRQTITIRSVSFSKNTNSAAFSLRAKAFTPLKYRSSNKRIVSVDSKGIVTVKAPGTAVIMITAGESESYLSAKKKVKVTVTLAAPRVSAKNLKKRKVRLSWTKSKAADGYKIYVKGPDDKKFKCRLTKSARVKAVTHKGLWKGKKYKYRIVAYKKINGRYVYSPRSRTLTVKIRK